MQCSTACACVGRRHDVVYCTVLYCMYPTLLAASRQVAYGKNGAGMEEVVELASCRLTFDVAPLHQHEHEHRLHVSTLTNRGRRRKTTIKKKTPALFLAVRNRKHGTGSDACGAYCTVCCCCCCCCGAARRHAVLCCVVLCCVVLCCAVIAKDRVP